MKITFREFHGFLHENGYSENEIRQSFHAVKSMDAESRSWVVKWFCTGELPKKEVEGVTVEYLIHNCGYKPLNAFIVLDWLKEDPQAAKYFVLKIPSTISPSDSIGNEMEEFLKKEGVAPTPLGGDGDMTSIKG